MLADRTRPLSPTQPSNSLSSKISALGAKLTRSLSRPDNVNGGAYDDEDRDSVEQLKYEAKERSQSRGREFHSSGRGGLGNIRQGSASRDARPESGPDDFSSSRGREPLVDGQKVFSTGRGGAGNIRSPSRDVSRPPAGADAAEAEVIKSYVAANQDIVHSTGRGGIGNLSGRSRSRGPAGLTTPGGGGLDSPSGVNSRSPARSPGARAMHSTGRGGAGNIAPGDGFDAEWIDEEERRRAGVSQDGFHSTGRGGAANLTSTPGPGVERHPYAHGEYESHGRGGAGNIVRDRSRSRSRVDANANRSRSRARD